MGNDATGWKRGAGPYSKSYPKLDQYGTPDTKVDRSGLVNKASAMGKPDGYSNALPKVGKNKGGGVY